MSTTAEKLALLLNTKAAIKAALVEKGVEVDNVFSTYPDKIRSIETYIEPIITVDDSGLVTAATGDKKVTHRITNTDDADLLAKNIVKNVNIFGVQGAAGMNVSDNGAGDVAVELIGLGCISVTNDDYGNVAIKLIDASSIILG